MHFAPIVLENLELTGLKSDDAYRFDSFVRDYTVMVANDNPTLTVRPMLAFRDSAVAYTIFENGVELRQDADGSVSVPLDLGQTKALRVALKVANLTTTNYVVRATREPSDDANLRFLRISHDGGVASSLDVTRTNYIYEIVNLTARGEVSDVLLEAGVENSSATIIGYTIDDDTINRADGISADQRGHQRYDSDK